MLGLAFSWAWAQRERRTTTAPPRPDASGPAPVSEAPPKFALLIGISQYQNQTKNLPSLPGAKTGVAALRRVLVNRFSFPDDAQHIKQLPDEQATAANIAFWFREMLVKNANRYPDGQFVFYFNGHGSQVLDQGNDQDDQETDGLDETLVPYDSRDAGNQHYDIRDDEMGAMMNELARFTRNALYIFDSCHSGTVNRGNGQVHEIPRDRRPQPQSVAKVSGPDNRLTNFAPASERYVMIAACDESEKARELENRPPDKPASALTYYLVAALSKVNRDTTYRELMGGIARILSRLPNQSPQHPVLVGDGGRLVLDGAADEVDAYLPLQPGSGPGSKIIKLAAGAELGLAVDTYIAVYDQKAARLRGPEARKAVGHVTQVTDEEAVVVLDEVTGRITAQDKAVLLAPQFSTAKLKVGLALPTNNAIRHSLNQQLAQHILLTPVMVTDAGAASDAKPAAEAAGLTVFVRYGSEQAAFAHSPPLRKDNLQPRRLTQQLGYYLTDAGGEPLFDLFIAARDPQAVARLTDALGKLARQRNLQALENLTAPLNRAVALRGQETPETRITLQFYQYPAGPRAPDGGYPALELNKQQAVTPEELRLGYAYHVALTNRSREKLWVYLLNLSTDGALEIMSPQDCPEAALAPGATTESFNYRLTPPLGYEGFKVIVTATPAPNICYLAQEKVNDATANDAQARRGRLINPLDALVAQALNGAQTRTANSATWDNWGTADFTVRVRP